MPSDEHYACYRAPSGDFECLGPVDQFGLIRSHRGSMKPPLTSSFSSASFSSMVIYSGFYLQKSTEFESRPWLHNTLVLLEQLL